MEDMSVIVMPIVFGVLLLVFGIVFLVYNNNQKKKSILNNQKNSNSKAKKNGNVKDNSKENVSKEDVFNFMEFDKIIDNMIVQENGTKFTMAIKCKGINYDLMSEVEQLAVEEGFITFLNTLRFPIQLYVQAQNIDLKSAINTYKQNASNIREEYEDANKEYTNLVEQFDSEESEVEKAEEKRDRVLNVYEYAADIINYVERLSLNKNLLQRNFYVLVSYYTSEITSAATFDKNEIINICYNELLTRAQTIISALASCSVSGEVLTSNDLADLLYMAYNRDDKGFLSVKEAIESGFYRLYSTSEDVFMKKQEKLQEQIDVEAEYRALDAMKQAIAEGNYISPEAEKLDIVDRISKQAAEIVKKEDLPNDVKEKAKKILVKNYKEDKKKILAESKIINGTKSEIDKEIETKNNENIENKAEEEDKEKEDTSFTNTEQLDNRMGFEPEQETNFDGGLRDVEIQNPNNKNEENTSSNNDDDLII